MNPANKINILLVDDQPANLTVLETVLAELDEVLVPVSSGEAALRELLARDFAMVLLDVQMPTMSGFETAELIRSHPRLSSVPIIFLTAGSDPGFPVEQAYALGAVDYLTKPFNPHVLRAKVSVFIDLYRKNAELARLEALRHEAALKSRDERIRLILDNTRDYAFIGTDVERRVTEWEGGAAAITGWSAREALGQSSDILFDDAERAAGVPQAEAARALDTGRAQDRRWHVRRDGSRFFADGVMVPLHDGGRLRGYAWIIRDATAERLAAERLEQSDAERERLYRAVQAANLLALGQRGALELAVADAPLADVLDVLAHTAEDYADHGALAAIQLVEPGGVRLRHVAAPSLPPELQAALEAPGVAPVGGASGAAAWRAETVFCADIATDPLWDALREPALRFGLRACRSVPILSPAGAVLGTFSWYYREPREPDAQEQEAMALLANTAALVIGQRHEAQERQAAEERSRAILESMSEGFIAVGRDWRITYVNTAAEQVTRLSREEMVGGQFWELFPQLRGTEREKDYRRTAVERVRTRVEAYLDEHGRWFEINSFPTPDGGIAVYFRDDTERRRAEEGNRRLAAVAEQSSDFIGIFSPEAGGLYLNAAGRKMAGLAPDADIGATRMLDFFAEECRPFVRAQVLPALTGAAACWDGELRFAQPGGASIPVYYKGFAVRDADGHHLGIATITRDITEQKRSVDELRRIAADLAEADLRKSEFLATLAHELRNPLAPIRTGLDLMRVAPGDAATRARVHEMMDRQLGHLIHLVDDLLDVARITRGKIELKKEVVDLKTAVAMALETSAAQIEGSGHVLQVDVPDAPLELEADVTRLVQVLSNLLNNAAKYTPSGGRITLAARREGAHAVVVVSDTGVGIAPESLGAVFEMFTQVRSSRDRAQGGLGIGLSLVRRLVELHGGRVGAYSAGPGQGSSFTVRLPLHAGGRRAGAAASAQAAAEGEAAPRALRVLVVDDNQDAADSLVALLGLLGHATRVAHDGPQGYGLAQEFRPDLVLLDIGLPGMSGHEVARAIRGNPELAHVVLIALTGWGGAGDLAQSQEAGFDQHLTKPVSFEALEQALAAAEEARQ